MIVAASFVLLTALGAAGDLKVVPQRGESVVIRSWSVVGGRLRGKLLDGKAWSIQLRRCWYFHPVSRPKNASAPLGAGFVKFRGGPKFAATFGGGTETKLDFELGLGGKSSIDKTFVQGFRTRALPKDVKDEGFDAALAKPPSDADLVFVFVKPKKIQRFRLRFVGTSKTEIQLDRDGEKLSLPLEKVYGVVFGETSGLAAPFKEQADFARVELIDGRVVRGQLVDSGEDRLRIRLLEGPTLELPTTSLRDVELLTGRLQYLSELKFKRRAKGSDTMGRVWPVLRDKGIGGGRLRVGTTEFRRGLLVVPTTVLKLELPKKFDRILGKIGMPHARYGSATVRILGGERELLAKTTLEANGRLRALDLPLQGERTITLEIISTHELDVGGRVVLGDLRAVLD